MIHVRAEFIKRGMRALVVGQVHDSVIVDCPTSEVQDVGRILHDVMTVRTQKQFSALTIPLKADVSCGPSYGEQDLTILPTGEITK
jgi:DNA polymerase I-like protein with 3'-5' exonuclease and polymerase domains